MAAGHDRAAKRIAQKIGGKYVPSKSPDVKAPQVRVEVKSKAAEIPKALRQIGGGTGRAYMALPAKELATAKERLQGLKTGLMDHKGTIVKRSTRKR